jgi:hypothetical protein
MARVRHPDTGEEREVQGEIPHFAIYSVEGEDRVDIDGQSWIVVDDGVNMTGIDG